MKILAALSALALLTGLLWLLSRLARAEQPGQPPDGGDEDHEDEAAAPAVEVHIKLDHDGMPAPAEFDRWVSLEKRIAADVDTKGGGLVDGNEVGGGFYIIFIMGDDPRELAEIASAHVQLAGVPTGSFLRVRDESGVLRRLDAPGVAPIQ